VCHVPTLKTRASYPIAKLAGIDAPIYTDLLLHDMGAALADGLTDGGATSQQWRTAPLIGLRFAHSYLHDGRAHSVAEAIAAHDGEAHGTRCVPGAVARRPAHPDPVHRSTLRTPRTSMKHSYSLALLTISLAACGGDDGGTTPRTDAQYQADVVTAMQTSISLDLADLVTAATELQTAAPTHAWDPVADQAAIDAMKSRGRRPASATSMSRARLRRSSAISTSRWTPATTTTWPSSPRRRSGPVSTTPG